MQMAVSGNAYAQDPEIVSNGKALRDRLVPPAMQPAVMAMMGLPPPSA